MSATSLTQTLRPYQAEGVHMLRHQSWRERGKRKTLLVLPTGGGKTSIASYVIDSAANAPGDRQHISLFFAHRKELIEQAHARLSQYGVQSSLMHGKTTCSKCGRSWVPSVGKERCAKCGHNQIEEDLENPVQVSSVQLLNRRLERLIAWATNRRVLVFIDEAHRVSADTYLAVIETLKSVAKSVIVVGLTATPYRLDGQGLDDVFEDIVEVTTPSFLFDNGQCPTCKTQRARGEVCCGALVRSYLMRPTMYGIASPSMKGVHKSGGEFNIAETAERMNKVRLVADIVETWKKYAEGLSTVDFGVNVAHSKAIAQAFIDAGVPWAHLDGETSADERADVLARVSIGDYIGVSNCGLFQEGWDPESDYKRVLDNPQKYWKGKSYPPPYRPLSVLIDACPTASMGRYFQQLGRIFRSHPSKTQAIYLGHAGNVEPPPDGRGHGFPDQHHSFDLSGYKRKREDGHVVERAPTDIARCTSCLAVWPAGTAICLQCGTVISRQRNIITINGELEQLTPLPGAQRPATPAEREAAYIALMAEARSKNQRPYFADDNYKSKFGQEPTIAMKNRVYPQFGYASYLRR